MAELIDIGANLTHDSFAHDFDEVLERAVAAGVSRMLVTGASIDGSRQARELAAGYDFLFATAGIHPHHAGQTDSAAISLLRELAADDRVKAIGETGLDFFRNFSPGSDQISSFERHIELAIETGLPLFLHERDAHPTFAQVLRNYRDSLNRLVVHCFTGARDALHAYLDLDCHIGITGWICDERRGEHLKTLVKDIPDDRLMIETDAPYLIPRSLRPKPKTRRNEPMYLPEVCRTVAACREVSSDDLARLTTANARNFFDLPA